jgi:hypothetical protein
MGLMWPCAGKGMQTAWGFSGMPMEPIFSPSRHTAENGMDCVGDGRGFLFDFIEEEGGACEEMANDTSFNKSQYVDHTDF